MAYATAKYERMTPRHKWSLLSWSGCDEEQRAGIRAQDAEMQARWRTEGTPLIEIVTIIGERPPERMTAAEFAKYERV
jgi:hypothetical protein